MAEKGISRIDIERGPQVSCADFLTQNPQYQQLSETEQELFLSLYSQCPEDELAQLLILLNRGILPTLFRKIREQPTHQVVMTEQV